MIRYAGKKVSANEFAKLEIMDRIDNIIASELDELDDCSDKELIDIEQQIWKRTQSIKKYLGVEAIYAKLGIRQ